MNSVFLPRDAEMSSGFAVVIATFGNAKSIWGWPTFGL